MIKINFKLSRIFDVFYNKNNKSKSEQHVSNAESSYTWKFDMFKVASDRISIIKDVQRLCGASGDWRFQRANNIIAEDACKGGFSVVVNENERAQEIINNFVRRTKLDYLCREHARSLLRDGDIFLNIICDIESGYINEIRKAPAITIKKNTDEYGKFFDVEKAYTQFDVRTEFNSIIECEPPSFGEHFALFQMNHIRWLDDQNYIYGTSQYAASRKLYRMLEKMEEANAIRRMYRSVNKRAHSINPEALSYSVEDYKRDNRMVDEFGNPTPNNHLLSDFIGKGVTISNLDDAANLDQVKDLEYMNDQLWIGLLVPEAIISGGRNINRDVLKVQYPHYLDTLNDITDRLEYGDCGYFSGYRDIINLQLMLQGINPEDVIYDIVWSQKTYESGTERLEKIQSALGKGGGKQIITLRKGIQLLANDFDIEDPIQMELEILREQIKTDK